MAETISSIFRAAGYPLSDISVVLGTTIFQATMIILYFVISSRNPADEISVEQPVGLGWSLRVWFLGYGISIISSLIFVLALPPYGDIATESVYESLINSNLDRFLIIITAVFMAPIAEELLFRKFLIDRFTAITSSSMALILSSLLFSSIHWLTDFIASTIDYTAGHIISTYILGLVFGLVYLKTGDIRVPILLHFINNAIGIGGLVAITVLGENVALAINGVLVVLALVAFIWSIVRFFKNRSSYWSNFKEGLKGSVTVLDSDHRLATVYWLFFFAIFPYLLYIFIPLTSLVLQFIVSSLSYIVGIVIALYTIQNSE